MRKFVSILFLFMLICSFSQSAFAEIKRETGFISLNSSIVKEIEPNLSSITFAVENTAETAQKASFENNQTSEKIIKALKAVSSADTDTIKTSNFSVRPVYGTAHSGKRVIKNYTAVNSVRVETKDVSKTAKFIDAAMSAGANRTDNLVYSLQNERQVCSSLYPVLVKELTKTASELASAAGSALDGLKSLSVSCNIDTVSNGRFFAAKALGASMDAAASETAASAPVESGKIKIRAYVNADYYVK